MNLELHKKKLNQIGKKNILLSLVTKKTISPHKKLQLSDVSFFNKISSKLY